MSSRAHTAGHCTCRTHSREPWQRSEHWKADEVAYLEDHFGRLPDMVIARKVGRSVMGIRLKAKRLGLHKRDAGWTSRELGRLFGVDESVISKVWIRKHGVLRATRPYRVGPHRVLLVGETDLLRFIRDHGEWIDVDRMPESPYRDLALEGGRWYSLPAVQRLTGRHLHTLAHDLRRGRWPARKRGPAWMVHQSQLAAIRATAGHNGRLASWERRERANERRRNARKGVGSIAA